MKTFNLKLSTIALCSGLVLLLNTSRARAVEIEFERDTSLPLVYINIAVKAGAVTDPSGQSGVTNFVGEMLLRGTHSRTKEQIDVELDQMGARLDVETRAEALIMRGAVLSSQLEPFLRIVSDLLTQSSFPEREIRKLKSEISSEILEELGRDQTLGSRRFTKFLFNGHPYGKPILGSVDNINHLTQKEIMKHYNLLFRDKLFLVVGTGDADLPMIKKWADGIAAARPSLLGSETSLTQVYKPVDAKTRRLQIIDKPERTQTQINIGQVGVRMTDDRFFPLFLGNHAFGGGSFSARLMVEIRVKRGWSYGANSYFRHGLQPRSWQTYLFPASKDTANALALALKLITDLKTSGITKEEFEFSKRSLVNGAGFMYDTPKKRVENALLERTLKLPDGFMKSYGPNLEHVTLESVNSAWASFLKPDQLAISVVATAKELEDSLAKAANVPADQVEVVPYTEE